MNVTPCHREDARVTVSSQMTGRELRDALAAAGYDSAESFYRALAGEMENGSGPSKESVVRTAKRWLSSRKEDEQLEISQKYRPVVARLAGVPEERLQRRRDRPRMEEVERRLESLEGRVVETDANLALVRADLIVLQEAIQSVATETRRREGGGSNQG